MNNIQCVGDSDGSSYVGGDKTNLIINYLPQGLTDEEFRNIFISIGRIKNSKIIRDKVSGYSFGFGFVDYEKEEDAERAIETLNGHYVLGKTIKVALARPGSEDIKGANLYIKNIPAEWTKEDLDQCFSRYGKIVQSRVLIDLNTKASRRVGFVLYDRRQEAEDAILGQNGTIPDGATETIYVKFANDATYKKDGNLGYFNMAQNSYKGGVQMGSHMFGNSMNGSVGHGGSRYPGPGPMRNQTRFRYNPVASSQGPNVANSPMIGTAITGGMAAATQEGYALYVYNIGDCNEKILYDLFKPFGTITKVTVMYDYVKNISKGFAFVTMANYVEAQNAIYHLNGYDLLGIGRALQVSFKTKK